MQTPDVIYGALFRDVQMRGVFPDSKTFVDATPKDAPESIIANYRKQAGQPGFALKEFVQLNFDIPDIGSSNFRGDPQRPVREHIEALWPVLTRAADQPQPGSSLIPLPNSYIVPGGRFGEIYYWDSYFTMLGLQSSGRHDMIRNMVDNFAHLIRSIGHIPNGNRSYFASRSQPPFFTLMVLLLDNADPRQNIFATYLDAIEAEYAFWMDGETTEERTYRRVVHFDDGSVLNRYWDDVATPRQESYREDVELATQSRRPPEALYRDLRAACESGWDFSSRWMTDHSKLASICTTEIIPVDLNCLLFAVETSLEACYKHNGQSDKADDMHARLVRRVAGIEKYCWDHELEMYCDYRFTEARSTGVPSLATVFPLFMDFAPESRAASVARQIERLFLKPGGLVTTPIKSGQQWDAPNGWAPLQWITYQGLQNYGFEALATDCVRRWIDNCLRVYRNTGKLVEKYNVENMSLEAGGGEYPVQDGFGWTNGVLLALMDALDL